MRARVISLFFLLLALASAGMAGTAYAQGAPSLERILPEIRRTTPGTFYDAQGPFPGPDGRPVYRIKWMTPDGRIAWFDADARTGRILGRGGPRPGRYPDQRFQDGRGGGYPHFGNPGYDERDNRGGWERGDRDGRRGHYGH